MCEEAQVDDEKARDSLLAVVPDHRHLDQLDHHDHHHYTNYMMI